LKQLPVISYQLPSSEPENPVTAHCSLVTKISDPWEEALVAEAELIEANTTSIQNPKSKIQNEGEGRRYKDVTGIAARQSKEISEEERKTVAAKLSEFVSNLSQKMKIKSDHSSQLEVRSSQLKEEKNNYELRTTNYELPNELESLNEMLLDPLFRKDSEILGQVKRYLSLGYLADYDDAGYPISVYAF